ncbi:hypothetical protein [Robiginitomaculum antarcticum]|uniref:hypothetical protein n=1 Tax=Robiginitomaculum antarcticum TaxID=437507 RepID=UPI00039F2CD7|nr:hypothetical protein [Robiginitomaculum antarcticum]
MLTSTSFKHLPAIGILLLGSAAFAPLATALNPTGLTALPTNAQPGECYARVRHGAKYATESQIVVIQDGYQGYDVQQPVIKTRQETVMTKEASVRYEVRQPQYKTINHDVMVRPSYETLSVSEPRFETVTETVQVSAPRRVWKRGNPGQLIAQGYNVLSTAGGGYGASGGSYGAQNSNTYGSGYNAPANAQHCGSNCEIWCLVEEPGEVLTYNRKVLASRGEVSRLRVPPKYTTIQKQVVSDPGGVREIPIQAEYGSVTFEDIIAPGQVQSTDYPEVTDTVARKRLIENERYEWMRVICDTGQIMQPGHSYSQPRTVGSLSGGPTQSYTRTTNYSSSGASTGIVYGGGAASGQGAATGISYGSGSASGYQASQPSAMMYGSSNSAQPDYGMMDYTSPSTPRTYGGEGMNYTNSPQ